MHKIKWAGDELTVSGQFLAAIPELKKSFTRPADELLYARALEGSDYTGTGEWYQKVIRTHYSLEARYYDGLFLKRQQRPQEAMEQFNHPVRNRPAPALCAKRKPPPGVAGQKGNGIPVK